MSLLVPVSVSSGVKRPLGKPSYTKKAQSFSAKPQSQQRLGAVYFLLLTANITNTGGYEIPMISACPASHLNVLSSFRKGAWEAAAV